MTIPGHLLAAMALFAFVTSVTPGPNNMMLLSSGVNFGFLRSVPHMIGISTSHFVMLVSVGAGLEKIFQSTPWFYSVMNVVGFMYLLYLAWGVAHAAAPSSEPNTTQQPMSYFQAVLFQWVNPKAWMMAVGYFTNYMPTDAPWSVIIPTCVMFSCINFLSVGVWAMMGRSLQNKLLNPIHRTRFNITLALLLVFSMIPVLFL